MTIRDRFDDLGYMFGRMPWRWDALVPFWILVTLGIGLIALLFTSPIWALASLACGALLGFLFGIPRVKQDSGSFQESSSDAVPADPLERGSGDSLPGYKQIVNTNLVEISDWLTKIIVGIGLVQLTQIPGHFESLVRFLAGTTHEPGFVGSVLVFFGVTGFLAGYLLTRLFLARAFSEADQSSVKINQIATTLPEQVAEPLGVAAQMEGAAERSVLLQLTNASPRLAILGAWEEIYAAARELLKKREPGRRLPSLATSVLQELVRQDLVSSEQATIYKKLREMRNLAAHSMALGVTDEAAAEFVNNALALIRHFKSLMNA